MMHVEAFHTVEAFDRLAQPWGGLLAHSSIATPFQRVEFQRAWWTHFGRGELCLLVVRRADVLVGLVSLYVDEDAVLRWVGGDDIADYLDVVSRAADAPEVRRAVLDWLAGPDAPDWQRAQLANIPEWSESAVHWQKLAAKRGWTADAGLQDVCPQFTLPDNFDDYLARLEGKQRREIRRKLRRASAEGARAVFIDPGEDNPAVVDDFIALMQASGPEKTAFLRPKMHSAFGDILRATQAAGMLGICFLELEGRPIAGYVYFSMGLKVYLYNSGYDPGVHAALSPGWVLLAHLIERVIESGHTHFDFMRGDEGYKYRFGGEDERVLRLSISR